MKASVVGMSWNQRKDGQEMRLGSGQGQTMVGLLDHSEELGVILPTMGSHCWT